MVHSEGRVNDGVLVGFSRLDSKEQDMTIHQDSTNNVLGVSYEDSIVRWKKKTIHARIVIALLTLVCTALIIVLLLTLELGLHCPKSTNTSTASSLENGAVKFLLFSDYHFDNYYDEEVAKKPTDCRKLGNFSTASYKAHYGRVGCDSPAALIDSMLGAIKTVDEASFVLMTGDFSAHNMDRPYFVNMSTPKRVLTNINISAIKTKTAFPKIPIFPMLGNNDLPGHYILPLDNSWYTSTLAIFAPLILCDGCPDEVPRPTIMDDLKKTFLDGGYYSVNLTGTDGRMVLIVLNSLYWNPYASQLAHGNPLIQKVARRQMEWLEEQLQQAKQKEQKVFISSHIPPGKDPYNGADFWLSNYTKMYVQLVAGEYKDVIAGQFYAHIHKDDFHLQVLDTPTQDSSQTPANKSFAILVPSVSPIYANNPSFRVGYIDVTKQALLDYDQFYLDLVMATQFNAPKWQFAYKFSERYPSTNPYIDAERIYELNQGLLNTTNDKPWLDYVFARTLFYQPAPYSRFTLYCAMRYVFDQDYKSCVQKYNVPGG